MGAASRLHLDREPLAALAMSVMLLAFAKDRAEQAALCQGSSLAVLNKLLQVPKSASTLQCSIYTRPCSSHRDSPRAEFQWVLGCLSTGCNTCSSSAEQPTAWIELGDEVVTPTSSLATAKVTDAVCAE